MFKKTNLLFIKRNVADKILTNIDALRQDVNTLKQDVNTFKQEAKFDNTNIRKDMNLINAETKKDLTKLINASDLNFAKLKSSVLSVLGTIIVGGTVFAYVYDKSMQHDTNIATILGTLSKGPNLTQEQVDLKLEKLDNTSWCNYQHWFGTKKE